MLRLRMVSLASTLALVVALSAGAAYGRGLPPRGDLLQALRASGKASPELIEAYERRNRAQVVVTLDVPPRHRLERELRRKRIRLQAQRMARELRGVEFQLRHRFGGAPGVAGRLHLVGAARLAAHRSVVRIDVDSGGHGSLYETQPLVGGYSANTAGWSGLGTTVAVLDSGVDTDHVDLSGAVVGEHCLCPSCCPDGSDRQTGAGAGEDDNGHGTLVSGVIASRGNLAPIGLAPAADLVSLKVLDDSLAFQFTSDIIAALEWIHYCWNQNPSPPDPNLCNGSPAPSGRVDVVNMSLVTTVRYTGFCDSVPGAVSMLADVVADLNDDGVVVVAAAGNAGDKQKLPAPACLSGVIAVGAVWDSDIGAQSPFPAVCADPITSADQVACYSNSSTTTDLFSPGGRMEGPRLGGGLGFSSGTSFASPSVAGCAALLVEQDDTRTPSELRGSLTASSTLVVDPVNTLIFPRLDCAESLGLTPDDDDSDFDGVTVGAGDSCPLDPNPLQGDFDGDSVGDVCDNCALVANGPAEDDQQDSDQDGVGDVCECSGRLYWAGDFDADGRVGLDDYTTWADNYGLQNPLASDGDIDCNGTIDDADYTAWTQNYRKSSDVLEGF